MAKAAGSSCSVEAIATSRASVANSRYQSINSTDETRFHETLKAVKELEKTMRRGITVSVPSASGVEPVLPNPFINRKETATLKKPIPAREHLKRFIGDRDITTGEDDDIIQMETQLGRIKEQARFYDEGKDKKKGNGKDSEDVITGRSSEDPPPPVNRHSMKPWPAEWPVFWEGGDPTGLGRDHVEGSGGDDPRGKPRMILASLPALSHLQTY